MHFLTQNLQGFPRSTADDDRHDIELAVKEAGIVVWQEAWDPRTKAMLCNLPGWETYAPAGGQAISWDTRWFKAVPRPDGNLGASHLLTRAVKGVSDERPVLSVVLEQIDNGRRFVVAGAHFPPKNKPGMAARTEWEHGASRLRALLDDWVAAGYPIILGMDANRQTKTHPVGTTAHGRPIIYRSPASSIDVIATIDSDRLAWQVSGVDTLGGRKSDHKGRRLRGWLAPAINAPAPVPAKKGAAKVAPPAPPFIAARWHGGSQESHAVVIHGTVSPCRRGGARDTAHFFATEANKTSAHYVVDPGEVIQCVGDHTVAYHCGWNTGSIAVELCDPQTGSNARWDDVEHQNMLDQAARLVAQLCLAYNIAMTHTAVSDLKAHGPHGIYGHNDSRLAFGHTTHTDPGSGFPWARFLQMVKAEAAALRAGK